MLFNLQKLCGKGIYMNVTVKYFAVCHEMLDRSEEEMELPDGATIQNDIRNVLEEEWPEIAEFYEVMQMSVQLGNMRRKHTETRRRGRGRPNSTSGQGAAMF